MRDYIWVQVGSIWVISGLWLLLGAMFGGVVVTEFMDKKRREALNRNDAAWYSHMEAEQKRWKDEVQFWKDFLDASTEHVDNEKYAIFEGCCGYHDEQDSGYFIQDEHALMEVGREEYEIWLAENGLKSVPDIDEDEMFIEWTEGKR